MNFQEFEKLDKDEQAKIYFKLSEQEQKKLTNEWTEKKRKYFKILGGIFDIFKIQVYCVPCGKVKTGITFWRLDQFNGYDPDDLVCPDCFRFELERERQDSILRKIKIISEMCNEK